MRLEFEVPIKASTSQNARMHWAQLARVRKSEKAAVAYRFHPRGMKPFLIITLTRIAPSAMDDDNLAGVLKGIRDGVAARLGIDDGSPLVRWLYRQERRGVREYAVVVRVEALSERTTTPADVICDCNPPCPGPCSGRGG